MLHKLVLTVLAISIAIHMVLSYEDSSDQSDTSDNSTDFQDGIEQVRNR
jgi:hypothetical protein